MRRANVPTFRGGADPVEADKWIIDIERNFRIFYIPDDMKREVVVPFGNVETW